MKKIEFLPDDRSKIQEYLVLTYPTDKRRTLEGILEDWEKLSADVKSVYQLTIYDYTNSLTIRERLYEITQLLSNEGRDLLLETVGEIDNAFKETTSISKNPVYGDDNNEFWWYYRIPLKFGDELKGDLKDRGFI